jgi:hypothetical protein
MEDYDDFEIERYISKLYINRIQKKRGIKANLSVSMPQDLKTDFLLACSYNGEDYKDLFEGWIKSYLKEKGLDVLVPRKLASIEEEQLELEELKAIMQEKGSARLKISTKYIHERILNVIRIPLQRGEWTVKDSVEIGDIESIVRDSVRKFGITWEDACSIIKARAEKIEKEELRRSIDVAVYELLTRMPGEGMRPREKQQPTEPQLPAMEGPHRVTFGKKVDSYEV